MVFLNFVLGHKPDLGSSPLKKAGREQERRVVKHGGSGRKKWSIQGELKGHWTHGISY